MGKRWSIDEIIFKLPLVDIKLKTSAPEPGQSSASAEGADSFPGLRGVHVGLKSFDGSFVTADLNTDGELVANRPTLDAWETFEFFRLPDGKVALRACNGKFVGAKLHEHGQLVADRPYVQGWEAFTLHRLPDGKFAFQAFNGSYVSADLSRQGELVANRPEASGWEAFTLMLAS